LSHFPSQQAAWENIWRSLCIDDAAERHRAFNDTIFPARAGKIFGGINAGFRVKAKSRPLESPAV
ncbi:MAG: hypothetical protein ACR2QG_00835, partial [Gammaproteobacteria bacterium]